MSGEQFALWIVWTIVGGLAGMALGIWIIDMQMDALAIRLGLD